MNCARTRQQGMTVVEVTVAMAFFSTLGVFVLGMMKESNDVLQTQLRVTRAQRECSSVLRTLREELEQASLATLVLDETNASHDVLTLQVPLGMNAGVVQRGARRMIAGRWQDFVDHSVQYFLVASGATFNLQRRLLDAAGAVVGVDEQIATGVAPPAGGLKGLDVTLAGDIISLRLQVQRNDGGALVSHTQQITLRIRNP